MLLFQSPIACGGWPIFSHFAFRSATSPQQTGVQSLQSTQLDMYRFRQFFLCCFLFRLFDRNIAEKIELFSRLNLLVNYVVEHEASQSPDLMLGAYLCEGNWI